MMRRKADTRLSDRGAAAVEFALVFPLLAAIVFGTVEYGWLLLQQFNVASAVRDGLRQGVTVAQETTPDPRATAVRVAQADLNKLGIPSNTVVLTASYSGTSPMKTMTLSADLTYKKLTGFVPTPAHLKYAMTMMLELQ